jgi:protoporphyrinogen oxidase
MKSRPLILILGAGPAGLGAAWRLARRGFPVTLADRAPSVGGNAGSFDCAGFRADFGSHRLHPSCSPEILSDIRSFLGDDLLDRPRHGRIHLGGRWLHFPLKAADLVLRAPASLSFGFARDTLTKPFRNPPTEESFASVLLRGLGPAMCENFYFPYARKIWGMEPSELDAEQARRRIAAGSAAKLIGKVLALLPGFSKPGAGRFFYPRRGFGQISEAYRDAALQAGARLLLNTQADDFLREDNSALVLSTIPLTQLVRAIQPAAPPDVLASASALRYRAMLLIYLVLDTPRFTEFDAHYFPSGSIRITRLSEPKNYSLHGPSDRTLLCAELPCHATGDVWRMTNDDLAQLVRDDLLRAGIPIQSSISHIEVKRLAQAYPIYERGFRPHFTRLTSWLDTIPRVVSLGRQGLFAHDNTHHTLAMAYAATDCVGDDGAFDRARWAHARTTFESFVVED